MVLITNKNLERMLSNNIINIFRVKKYRLCHLQKLLLPWALVLLAKRNNQCIASNTICSKPHKFDTRVNIISFLQYTVLSNYFPFGGHDNFYCHKNCGRILELCGNHCMKRWKIIWMLSNHLIVALGYQGRIQTLLHSDFDYKQNFGECFLIT